MESLNENLLKEWLHYKVEFYHIAAKTYTEYDKNLKEFITFLEEQGLNLMTATQQVFIDYRKRYAHLRPDSVVTYFAAIRSFYTWMCHPTVGKLPVNPMPSMRMPKSPSHPNFVPTAADIFKMRLGIRSLIDATLFECYLSSGMRLNELLQLRACDLDWNAKPQDFELRKPSPYVAASINLSPAAGISTKRGKFRTVFLSRLAGKIMLIYLKSIGIKATEDAPIFPLTEKAVGHRMVAIGRKITTGKLAVHKPGKRRIGFLDVDVDKLGGTEAYKEAVRKGQNAEVERQKDAPLREQAFGVLAPRTVNLHPHCLRHFFAVAQYHRNYYGNRRDLITLRDLMGHSSTDQTNVYVTSMPVVKDDMEWKRIYLGNGFDYRSLIQDYL